MVLVMIGVFLTIFLEFQVKTIIVHFNIPKKKRDVIILDNLLMITIQLSLIMIQLLKKNANTNLEGFKFNFKILFN